jgi:hypothetical protein
MQEGDRQSWSRSNKGRLSASERGNEATNHVLRGRSASNQVSGDGLRSPAWLPFWCLAWPSGDDCVWAHSRQSFRLEPAHRPRPPRMAHSLGGAKSPSSPRDPLHHLLIALLFCNTPFVSKPILSILFHHIVGHLHRQTPPYRSYSNITAVLPTSWHRPCSTVLKPSSNSSSRPNRVSGAAMHICPKNSAMSSGYRPPSSPAMYTPRHALPWLTKHHGRCPRRQIWCTSQYGRLFWSALSSPSNTF